MITPINNPGQEIPKTPDFIFIVIVSGCWFKNLSPGLIITNPVNTWRWISEKMRFF